MQRTHMSQSQVIVQLHQSKMATLIAEFQRDLKALKEEFNSEQYDMPFETCCTS
jgi:hypothetical protein